MTNYIREMSGKQYLKRLAENPTVIIPTGACEIYGPQLPMGSDLIAAKRIAELVAEKTGALIAPTIEAGESSALASFPCTFAMPRKILEDWLDFLVGKLIKDGAKNFVFITGHAGNVDTVNYIGKKYLNEHDIRLVQIDWWRFTNANGSDIFQYSGQMAHGHASECGTSVMLHLYPELWIWTSSPEWSRSRQGIFRISLALAGLRTGRPTGPSATQRQLPGKKGKRS